MNILINENGKVIYCPENALYENYIEICVDNKEYIIQEPTVIPNLTQPKETILSAFCHLSARVIVHKNTCIMLADLLKNMNQNADYYFEKPQLKSVYNDIVSAHSALSSLKLKEKLPSLSTASKRSQIPKLEDLIIEMKRIIPHCEVRSKFSQRVDNVSHVNDFEDLKERSTFKSHLFVVGGEVFSRGITIPNLIVTLFGRHVTTQEQLLQFCRCFGHRKSNQLDLLVVFGGNLQKCQYENLWTVAANNFGLVL